MTSVVFSILLFMQVVAPAAPVRVTGRLSVEGGAQTPSSFTLPLIPATGANQTLTIRPQIDGSFRIQVRAGEYRPGAPVGLPPGYMLQSITYGGVDLRNNPLKVATGDKTELLIGLALNGPSPAVSVSGRVTGITPGQFQRIALREETPEAAALETSVNADGTFTFPKVLPGRYIVYMRLRTVTPLTVGNQDVTGLIVAHPQDIFVSGHVIAEGGLPIPTSIIVEGNGKAPPSQNRANGTFYLSLEKGENSIAVRNIPEPYRLKSITYGDVDLQKQPLKLDGPANWDIIVRLAPKD
jgi:hypothetical protein